MSVQTPAMQMLPAVQLSNPVVSPAGPTVHAPPPPTVPSGTQATSPIDGGPSWTTTHVHFCPVLQPCAPGAASGSHAPCGGASGAASAPPVHEHIPYVLSARQTCAPVSPLV